MYAFQRLRDLRGIARQEARYRKPVLHLAWARSLTHAQSYTLFLRCPLIQIALGAKMDGQNVFDSGWEWGYWLQDVIAARAVWNPYMPRDSEMALLRNDLR